MIPNQLGLPPKSPPRRPHHYFDPRQSVKEDLEQQVSLFRNHFDQKFEVLHSSGVWRLPSLFPPRVRDETIKKAKQYQAQRVANWSTDRWGVDELGIKDLVRPFLERLTPPHLTQCTYTSVVHRSSPGAEFPLHYDGKVQPIVAVAIVYLNDDLSQTETPGTLRIFDEACENTIAVNPPKGLGEGILFQACHIEGYKSHPIHPHQVERFEPSPNAKDKGRWALVFEWPLPHWSEPSSGEWLTFSRQEDHQQGRHWLPA